MMSEHQPLSPLLLLSGSEEQIAIMEGGASINRRAVRSRTGCIPNYARSQINVLRWLMRLRSAILQIGLLNCSICKDCFCIPDGAAA